jgi:hypothetical protein
MMFFFFFPSCAQIDSGRNRGILRSIQDQIIKIYFDHFNTSMKEPTMQESYSEQEETIGAASPPQTTDEPLQSGGAPSIDRPLRRRMAYAQAENEMTSTLAVAIQDEVRRAID